MHPRRLLAAEGPTRPPGAELWRPEVAPFLPTTAIKLPPAPVVAALVLLLCATSWGLASPGLVIVASTTASVVVDTVATLAQLLAALVAYGRFRVEGRAGDAVASAGFGLLGAANLVLSVVPQVLSGSELPRTSAAPVIVGAIACLAFAIAASLATTRQARPGTVTRDLAGLLVTVSVLISTAVLTLPTRTLTGVGPEGSAAGIDWAVAGQLVSALLCATAVAGSARSARSCMWWRWLAPVFALMCAARVAYSVTPAHAATSLTIGDGFRLAAYVILIALCASEISSMWRRLAYAAVAEERRRMARELHDGVAQELDFIAWQATRGVTSDSGRVIASAAERARAESRRAIHALTAERDEHVDEVVRSVACDLEARMSLHLALDLEPGVSASMEAREAIARVVAEAVRNAARHAGGTRISVKLATTAEHLEVSVEDQGKGFDPALVAGPDRGHFGLQSMQERASALGGVLLVHSSPGLGARVTLRLPVWR